MGRYNSDQESAAKSSIHGAGVWTLHLLSRCVRRDKLRIDPTLQATALHLDPISVPACNFEARAFGGGPDNSPGCRWCRPDVHVGTLQKNGIPVLDCRDSLACRAVSSRSCRGNLGRSLHGSGRGKIGPGNRRWLRRWPRDRLDRSRGWGLHRWSGVRSLRGLLACRREEEVRKRPCAQYRPKRSAGDQLSPRSPTRLRVG